MMSDPNLTIDSREAKDIEEARWRIMCSVNQTPIMRDAEGPPHDESEHEPIPAEN